MEMQGMNACMATRWRVVCVVLGLTMAAALAACGGGSGGSNGLSLPESSVLAAPANQTVQSSTTGVALSWSATAGAQSYAVYRCPVPAGTPSNLCDAAPLSGCSAPVATSATTSFLDVPPQPAPQAYCYRVAACADTAGQVCGAPGAGKAAARRLVPGSGQQASSYQAEVSIPDSGREVISGMATTLYAFPTVATGTVTYTWTQESGPKVTLSGADTANLSFTTPVVTQTTPITFDLRIRDANGPGRTAKASLNVLPPNGPIVSVDGDRIVQTGHQVTLHARGSAGNLVYAWRQVSTGAAVTLTDATSANPGFIAPPRADLPADGVLRFQVTATDPTTGQSAMAQVSVLVQSQVPVPGPTPNPVPNPVPAAHPFLAPLQMAQPLQVPLAVPLPQPVVVPPLVPPQALQLQALPVSQALGGTVVPVTALLRGGQAPYQWAWVQTSGPAATLTNAAQAVALVQLPVVSTVQTLSFRATVTDAAGAVRTAQVLVQATPTPQAAGSAPTPLSSLTVGTVGAGDSIDVPVGLTAVTLTQIAGPQLQLTQQAGATGTVVTVGAPAIQENASSALVRIDGTDASGQASSLLLPLSIVRGPSTAPAVTAPPIINPVVIPTLNDRLLVMANDLINADEGKSASIVAMAQGGRGSASYNFKIEYQKAVGGPDIALRFPDHPWAAIFDVPAVTYDTDLSFRITVTDGGQTATKEVTVRVHDLQPSLAVGTLAAMSVTSGSVVSLHNPVPTGGLPYINRTPAYDYSVRQTSGPTVALTPVAGQAGNWTFTAPMLAAGALDVALSFELTATDRIGNVIAVSQAMTVTVPVPPVVAAIGAPAVVPLRGSNLALQGSASGGVPPYTYQWTMRTAVEVYPGNPARAPQSVSSGQANWSPPVPNIGSNLEQVKRYDLELTLVVTDAQGRQSRATGKVPVLLDLALVGSNALQCGDLAAQVPCNDLDLVLAMTTACPDTKPFAMNTIYKINGRVTEYRYCVGAQQAYDLYWVQTRGVPEVWAKCERFDPTVNQGDLSCHLACYGDGCNIATAPDAADRIRLGPNGRLVTDRFPSGPPAK